MHICLNTYIYIYTDIYVHICIYIILNINIYVFMYVHPRMEKSHSGRPQTGRFPTFKYLQVVNLPLLRLLDTNLLVYYWLLPNYSLKSI